MSATLLASYSETNQNTGADLYTSSPGEPGTGQSFTTPNDGINYTITSAKFYVKYGTSGAGNTYAKLYAHSGTYGTSSVPTGTALATSDPIDFSTWTSGYTLIEWTFSTGYQMTANTNYVITLESTAVIFPEIGSLGTDTTSPTATGNGCHLTSSWTAESYDVCFYVYGSGVQNLTLTAGTGAFTLTGNSANVGYLYTLIASTGAFVLTGIDAVLRFAGWSNQTKNTSSWGNTTKNTSTFTNISKNTSTWTNQDKN